MFDYDYDEFDYDYEPDYDELRDLQLDYEREGVYDDEFDDYEE